MSPDEFKSIKTSSRGIFKDRGSKFIAITYRVNSIDDVKEKLDEAKKEFRDARHHCYAYKIGLSEDIWRVNDDGEPTGTAGKPIMGQIKSFDLTNILIVVVRYFGGTLLGVGGLINAYRKAASDAIKNASIVTEQIKVSLNLEFPYISMNDVMKLIKEEGLEQSNQVFELECSLRVTFRLSQKEDIIKKIELIENLSYTLS